MSTCWPPVHQRPWVPRDPHVPKKLIDPPDARGSASGSSNTSPVHPRPLGRLSAILTSVLARVQPRSGLEEDATLTDSTAADVIAIPSRQHGMEDAGRGFVVCLCLILIALNLTSFVSRSPAPDSSLSLFLVAHVGGISGILMSSLIICELLFGTIEAQRTVRNLVTGVGGWLMSGSRTATLQVQSYSHSKWMFLEVVCIELGSRVADNNMGFRQVKDHTLAMSAPSTLIELH